MAGTKTGDAKSKMEQQVESSKAVVQVPQGDENATPDETQTLSPVPDMGYEASGPAGTPVTPTYTAPAPAQSYPDKPTKGTSTGQAPTQYVPQSAALPRKSAKPI